VGAESEKLGHLGPFGACRNRPDFFRGQPAACKLLKTIKSQVGSRLKSANPGPANAQEACYGRACQSNEAMPPPRDVRFAANSGPADDQAGCGMSQTSVPQAQVLQTERTYHDLNALMREIADARVWAGLHWRHSIRHGAQIGRKVAKHVCDNFFGPQ
jgi:hypothetical protein